MRVQTSMMILTVFILLAAYTMDRPRLIGYEKSEASDPCATYSLDRGPFPIPNEIMDYCFPGVDY